MSGIPDIIRYFYSIISMMLKTRSNIITILQLILSNGMELYQAKNFELRSWQTKLSLCISLSERRNHRIID